VSKQRTADLVDRWENASAKTKPAAIRALSIAIAKTSNRPELLKRIESEISDTFDETLPEASSNNIIGKRSATPDKSRKQAVGRNGHGQKPDLAVLAKANDIGKYVKAREQGDR